MPDEERLAVYLVTGNDDWDDPAWGIVPIFTGDAPSTKAWLSEQAGVEQLSVMRSGVAVWAAEFLAGETSLND